MVLSIDRDSERSESRPPTPPKGWKVRRSVGSGKWYYVDLITGEACWDHPTVLRKGMDGNTDGTLGRDLRTQYQRDYPEKQINVSRGSDKGNAARRAWAGLRGGWKGYSDPNVHRDFTTTSAVTWTPQEMVHELARHHKMKKLPPAPKPEKHNFTGVTTNSAFYKGVQPPKEKKEVKAPKLLLTRRERESERVQALPVERLSTETTNRKFFKPTTPPKRPAQFRPKEHPISTSAFVATTQYTADFTEVAYDTEKFQRELVKGTAGNRYPAKLVCTHPPFFDDTVLCASMFSVSTSHPFPPANKVTISSFL